MGAESNPFDFKPATRATGGGPSIVTYLVIGVVVLGILAFGYWLVTNAGDIGHRYRGDAVTVDDDELWTEFIEDEKAATRKYKEVLVKVTGVCSTVERVQTPAWAPSEFQEGFTVQMGKKETRLTSDWKIECFIPNRDKNVRLEVDKIQQGGTLTVEGVCKGKLGRQVCISDCRIVKYEPGR